MQLDALFHRENLHVIFVRQSPSFELFMRGGLDATLAMWYNEYHRLIAFGLNPEEMTTFFFSGLNLNQPEDGIYCLMSTLDKSPETAAALVRASVAGWEYAFAHPEETVDTLLTIMKQQKVRANRAHQAWMLARMHDIILVKGQTKIDTRLDPADFANTGHNSPLLPPRDTEALWIPPQKELVASIMEETRYTTRSLIMQPEDTLFIYTDGVTEAMDREQTLYSEQRLLVIINQCRGKSAKEIAHTVDSP